MIEVTKRDHMGVQQTLYYLTEREFGELWDPREVVASFANDNIDKYAEKVSMFSGTYVDYFNVYSYVAYNKRGKLLTVDHLVGISRKYNKWYLRRINWSYHWRGGYKTKNCHYYRHPKTTNELRANEGWRVEEFEDFDKFQVKGRIRYTGNKLATYWDEIPRSSWSNSKTWKKYRKTQWKNNNSKVSRTK